MSAISVAINGFGRIGRLVLRAALSRGKIAVKAINDLADAATLAHLFKYDSIHGRYGHPVRVEEVVVAGEPKPQYYLVVHDKHGTEHRICITSQKDPAALPWKELGIQVVLESTGRFTEREKAAAHLQAGVNKVLISAPAKGEDLTVVLGVNDAALKPEYQIVSNASCTTNCLAPMAKVLHQRFGIVRGMMNTIHSYTNDQNILDLPHRDGDLRRARAAAVSIVPTTTGAAVAVGKVLPELKGKLDGLSIRVPTPDGSLCDFTAELSRPVRKEEINAAFKEAANGELKGYLEYSEEPLVLADIIGNPASCIFDALSTNVVEGNFIKVLGWYDNEWGYANRCAELLERLG